MTTLEIAQRYGVPTPETCRELDYEKETFFWWQKYMNRNTKEDVWVLNSSKANNVSNNYDPYLLFANEIKFYKAPQIHEIAPLLPYWCEVTIKGMRDQYVLKYDYKENEQVKSITINLKDLEIAEAYAQLYLKLKKENLL